MSLVAQTLNQLREDLNIEELFLNVTGEWSENVKKIRFYSDRIQIVTIQNSMELVSDFVEELVEERIMIDPDNIFLDPEINSEAPIDITGSNTNIRKMATEEESEFVTLTKTVKRRVEDVWKTVPYNQDFLTAFGLTWFGTIWISWEHARIYLTHIMARNQPTQARYLFSPYKQERQWMFEFYLKDYSKEDELKKYGVTNQNEKEILFKVYSHVVNFPEAERGSVYHGTF